MDCENIYSKDLEEMPLAHPAVVEVAVVGLPDEQYGEVVGAFIPPVAGATIDKAELFAYAREHLAPHQTPKRWVAVDEFPLTGSGKIQKCILRERWAGSEGDRQVGDLLSRSNSEASFKPPPSFVPSRLTKVLMRQHRWTG